MSPDEWESMATSIALTWPECDPADWFVELVDLDGGHVASALVVLAGGEERPSPALIRRTVNAQVRKAAADNPHPSASGGIGLREWLAAGAPCAVDGDGMPINAERAREILLGPVTKEMP